MRSAKNTARAQRAKRAMAEYIIEDMYAKKRQHVIDLLTDLRHFCDANHIDFEQCDRTATDHHLAELRGQVT